MNPIVHAAVAVARPAIRVVIFGNGIALSGPAALTVAGVTLASVALISYGFGLNSK